MRGLMAISPVRSSGCDDASVMLSSRRGGLQSGKRSMRMVLISPMCDIKGDPSSLGAWRAGGPRIETRHATGCLWILIEFDIAEREVPNVPVGNGGVRN